jgi:hypothetical protein
MDFSNEENMRVEFIDLDGHVRGSGWSCTQRCRYCTAGHQVQQGEINMVLRGFEGTHTRLRECQWLLGAGRFSFLDRF